MHREHKFMGYEHMFKDCEHKFTVRKYKIFREGFLLCTFICLLSFFICIFVPVIISRRVGYGIFRFQRNVYGKDEKDHAMGDDRCPHR